MVKKYVKGDLIDAIVKIKKINGINPKLREKIFNQILWWITEHDGKYSFKNLYYTEGAKKTWEKNKKNKKLKNKYRGLRHDHLWGRAGLKDDLMKAVNEAEIRSIYRRVVGIIVTKEEHDKLHKKDKNEKKYDGFKKYKKAGINVFNENGRRVNLRES